MRTDFNSIAVVQEEGIVQLVLDRPQARNAFSHEMMAELDAALDAAEADPQVLAVVLRGEGKLFSAGHDLQDQMGDRPFHMQQFPNASPSVPPQLPRAWYFRKPLIGAVHNYVGPYAFAIIACCDFNIAAAGTRFSCEVFKGSYPAMEWLPLYLQLPMRVIEKLWLMGGWMDAEQALQFQLVQRVLPEDAVVAEALRWARQAALIPSESFAQGKDRIRRSIELLGLNDLPAALERRLPQGHDGKVDLAAVRAKNALFDPEVTKV
ncbi:MAG TPA: enoyl-CoA hydratase/isomerase family protein [Sphingobium sp.]|nr:enoyl-CoA hydratase/isomerase family protein [Sphingobium sp.]